MHNVVSFYLTIVIVIILFCLGIEGYVEATKTPEQIQTEQAERAYRQSIRDRYVEPELIIGKTVKSVEITNHDRRVVITFTDGTTNSYESGKFPLRINQ